MTLRDDTDILRSPDRLAHVRDAAGSGPSIGDELTKLAGLRDAGTITEQEFQVQKAKLLS